MGKAAAHKFGQTIGYLLEVAISPHLQAFADKHKLYLDQKGKRPTRGKKVNVSWHDAQGNKHDLDFVLERGGSANTIGNPVAFIEIAWRRYKRHSKNKVQEIEAAVMPLAEKYSGSHPFKGAVLAGEFTGNSITQLASHGFGILYFPYSTVLQAFAKFGIDAAFEESSEDSIIYGKIDQWAKLPNKDDVGLELMRLNQTEITAFINQLEVSILRTIERVIVVPLHGKQSELTSIQDAMKFLTEYDESTGDSTFVRYEIFIKYSNGDKIEGSFAQKSQALDFLKFYV